MSCHPSADIRSTCPYCGVGCGVVITEDQPDTFSIAGDVEHPANFGRLCSKGAALADTLHTEDRLTHPSVDGETLEWDSALDLIAESVADTIATHGRDAVAFYVSGQLLTEDYYVANKFVKGWLGNANIDTNSRLCMASSVVGHKRAFGTDTVPGCYEDLEQADLIVLVGSNLAWCHPVLYQRIQAAREARSQLQLIVIDPRRTATAVDADMHLALKPDTDLELFAGLLADLVREQHIDTAYIEAHVSGFDQAAAAVQGLTVSDVARDTDLDESVVADFYRAFGNTQRVVTVYSQGVNQGERGSDTVNAIIDCHLATGRIGQAGMGPFSVTGQPNAMGGREVGGLATMLAAHTDLEDESARKRVHQFWNSPRIADKAGPKAVDLFERVASGDIKLIWIMATNPVDSMPRANRVRDALAACPMVIVSDVTAQTDTARLANVLLPSAAWSEKDGTVTNSERRISRQRAFRRAPGEARPDWWQIAEVAKRLGWGGAFDWTSAAMIFREHAALSKAAGSADFDIGDLQAIDDADYDALAPFQWPRKAECATPVRFFSNGQFHTPDARARMRPIELARSAIADQKLVLNTGRIRDQWHTMTRTGRVSTLGRHLAEPFVEISPTEAHMRGIHAADIVNVSGADASVRVRALLTDRQPAGGVFVPFHWSDHYASQARVDTLVSARVDPFSGQPALKSERVDVERWPARSFAYVVCRSRPAVMPDRERHYWAIAPTEGGWRIELASIGDVDHLLDACQSMLADCSIGVAATEYHDTASNSRRLQYHRDGALSAMVLVSPTPVLASRHWLASLLKDAASAPAYRSLAGVPGAQQADTGAIVCSCFEIGSESIRHVIEQEQCRDLASLARVCAAGTNCGSCRPELKAMLSAMNETAVA